MRRLQVPAAGETTAVLMATAAGINHRLFRRKLRAARLAWHGVNDRWTVRLGSTEHRDMERVLAALESN